MGYGPADHPQLWMDLLGTQESGLRVANGYREAGSTEPGQGRLWHWQPREILPGTTSQETFFVSDAAVLSTGLGHTLPWDITAL